MATGNPLSMQVLDALSRGDRIGAIKLVRQAGGTGLKAAMRAIEAQAGHVSSAPKPGAATSPNASQARALLQERRPPTVAMGDPPGQLRWLLVVAGLLAAAAWLGFSGGF